MLQSVPVLTQRVRSADMGTTARRSPFAVVRGSRNLTGSRGFGGEAGAAAGRAEAGTRRSLLGLRRCVGFAGGGPGVTAPCHGSKGPSAAKPGPGGTGTGGG